MPRRFVDLSIWLENDVVSRPARAAMQPRIEAHEGVRMTNFEPRAVAPRIRTPTLVVHDRQDRIDAFADVQAYAHAIQGAELLATGGLGHRRILQDAGVLATLTLFLR